MWRLSRALAFGLLVMLGACGWRETAVDFTYRCADSFHPLDGPHCEHWLTSRYLLRYGEGSGDYIVLAFSPDGGGSGGLIDQRQDRVAQLGLDNQLLVVRTRDGLIYVAPAHPEGWPDIVGPLAEEEFAARYPSAPQWRDVQ
jgi:hypothetical protein